MRYQSLHAPRERGRDGGVWPLEQQRCFCRGNLAEDSATIFRLRGDEWAHDPALRRVHCDNSCQHTLPFFAASSGMRD